jgi:hypothetical protein
MQTHVFTRVSDWRAPPRSYRIAAKAACEANYFSLKMIFANAFKLR